MWFLDLVSWGTGQGRPLPLAVFTICTEPFAAAGRQNKPPHKNKKTGIHRKFPEPSKSVLETSGGLSPPTGGFLSSLQEKQTEGGKMLIYSRRVNWICTG